MFGLFNYFTETGREHLENIQVLRRARFLLGDFFFRGGRGGMSYEIERVMMRLIIMLRKTKIANEIQRYNLVLPTKLKIGISNKNVTNTIT